MKDMSGFFSGIYTVWYRDVLSLVGDRTRLGAAVFMTLIVVVGLGFGLGGVIGKVGGSAAGAFGAAAPMGIPFVAFAFPAMLGMTVLSTALQSTMSIVYDREFGFMRKILVAPVSRTSVALGKVAGGVTVSLIQALITMAALPFIGVHVNFGALALSTFVLILLAAAITALGVLVAARQKSQQGFQLVAMLVMMPLMLLSMGSFLPSFGSGMMTTAFKIASLLNPVSYGVDALRQLMLGSSMPANLVLHPVLLDVSVLAALFVAFLVPGIALFSKQD